MVLSFPESAGVPSASHLDREIEELLAEAAQAERDNRPLPMDLKLQNEVDIRKDMLSTIAWAKAEIEHTTGRSPPGATDCWLLAYGQVKSAIVVTDDLGMHTLAADAGLKVWHGFELLAKLRTAKIVDNDLVREIYDALERNGDMTETWHQAKHTDLYDSIVNADVPGSEGDSIAARPASTK